MNAWAGSSPWEPHPPEKRTGGAIFHIGTAAGKKAAGQPPRERGAGKAIREETRDQKTRDHSEKVTEIDAGLIRVAGVRAFQVLRHSRALPVPIPKSERLTDLPYSKRAAGETPAAGKKTEKGEGSQ